jgi:hypothetical protein
MAFDEPLQWPQLLVQYFCWQHPLVLKPTRRPLTPRELPQPRRLAMQAAL